MSKPLLVVAAHDAGGAEIVSSWLRRIYHPYPGLKDRVWFCLDGPAREIFERKLGPLPDRERDPIGDPAQVQLVLCGTSATASLEKDLVQWAMEHGLRTAVWLDHWKNYDQRFRRAPSEIWVTDQRAARLAHRLRWLREGATRFYRPKILVQGNPYLDDLLANVRRLEAACRDRDTRQHLLIVYDRGEDILWLDPAVWPHADWRVRNRPHPADRLSKTSLAEDLAWADTVIGWDSMALVAAAMAGKTAYSVLPAADRYVRCPGIKYVESVRIPGARRVQR